MGWGRVAAMTASLVGAMTLAVGSAAAQTSPAQILHKVLADYDAYLDRNDPLGAGQRGDMAQAALWPDDSPVAEARRNQENLDFKARLDAIPATALTGEDALNRELLEARLTLDIQGAAFDEDRIPFTNDEGFFLTPSYAADGTIIHNEAEAKAWLHRIASLPAYYDIEIANMRRGIATGFTSPRLTAQT